MEPSSLPRPSDLLIREQVPLEFASAGALESADGEVFNSDGTVNMVLIRPCAGRGPYNNIYEADVLARDAGKFKGWSMFDGHDSPVARKARAGLPRSVSELAGTVRESWWDPNFSGPEDTESGFQKGAVIGRCALTDAMEALVRRIPEAIKGSLNAQATNKRLGERNGSRGWIVEGFVNDPENSSFDLVTKAGAGGRVRSVLEALYDGINEPSGHTTEGEPGEMSQTEILEALQSDEGKQVIAQMVADGVAAGIAEALPAALEDRESAIREAVREEIGEAHRLRGLHAQAKAIIEAATLPKAAKDKLLADYGLVENDDDTVTAGRSLALIESVVDGDGQVSKSTKDVLAETLGGDIKTWRAGISEAAPTMPRAPGSGTGAGAAPRFGGEGSAWGDLARRRGLDPSQFGAPKPAETTTTASGS